MLHFLKSIVKSANQKAVKKFTSMNGYGPSPRIQHTNK